MPVPTNIPFPTTISITGASVVSGTTATTSLTSALPASVPALSIGRRTPQALTTGATIIEFAQLQASQNLAGTGVVFSVVVPSNLVPSGSHVWAQTCLTDTFSSGCSSWDNPIGPASATASGNQTTLSLTIPVDALPVDGPHTVALYTIADGLLPTPTAAQNSSWTTSGKEILLNATPFIAKGVAYGNTPIGCNVEQDPLDVHMTSTWTQDLALIRAMGANALHAYDARVSACTGPPPTNAPAPDLSEYLTSAWNGGSQPIYTLISVYFGAPGATDCPTGSGYSCYSKAELNGFIARAHSLGHRLGSYPAFMGIAIGNETNNSYTIGSPTFWSQMSQISSAFKAGVKLRAGPQATKLTVYSAVDDNLGAISQGEAMNPAPTFDVWGYDVYRGPTFGGGCPIAPSCLWSVVSNNAKRPFLQLEWGAPADYRIPPPSGQNYASAVLPSPSPGTPLNPCTTSLPYTAAPTMNDMVFYSSCAQLAAEQYYVTTGSPAVNSGGFVFEFADEYYKAGGPPCWLYQCPGTNDNYTDTGPMATVNSSPAVGYLDSAYFGLFAIGSGTPNSRTPRQSYCWFAQHWAQNKPAGCPTY